ncbi:MAG: cytochrome c biogenesis protein CcsA [Bacteroidales bacterium]|nr:cytochrome c biogenesis protein CcsA [Bacteroidales bacterium]
MKKFLDYIISTRMMAILIAIFGISIAVATFIENDFGTAAARSLVYNARWYEILLLLGIINLIGVTIKSQLYKREKLTLFIFHISFVFIILGAGITRYFGFEGLMHIREGERVNYYVSDNTYLQIKINNRKHTESYSKKVIFSEAGRKKFKKNFSIDNNTIKIRVKDFILHAEPAIMPDDNGNPLLELITVGTEGRKQVILGLNDSYVYENTRFVFSDNFTDAENIVFSVVNNQLFFKAPFLVTASNMGTGEQLKLEAGTIHPLVSRQLYNFGNLPLVLRSWIPQGKIVPQRAESNQETGQNAVIFAVDQNDQEKEIVLWGKPDQVGEPVQISFGDVNIRMSYGAKLYKLSFVLELNDFIVDRYPGSNSPSWFESKVTLIDTIKQINEPRRIYMNNILKHNGYRFYQSSYDPDEKGTILSVNYDYLGTIVTYAGYLLMSLGMFLSLFNKNSRFQVLSRQSKENSRTLQGAKIASILLFLVFVPHFASAQQGTVIPIEQATSFSKLLIQDKGGRIKPINTFSSEILRKVSRKNSFNGLTSDQVLLGMLSYPAYWQNQPMIKVGHDQIKEMLGITGNHVAFNRVFDPATFDYMLKNYVDQAYRKKPAYRSKFDTEIIRLDERINICYMIYTWDFLNIFPNPNDPNQKWNTPTQAGEFQTEDSVFVEHIIPLYIQSIQSSAQSGNWDEANKLLQSVKKYQHKFSSNLIPSDSKVKLEIFYNSSDIFTRLSSLYGLVGFILLLLQFTGIFWSKLNLRIPTIIAGILIMAAFVAHTVGLGLRWNISGHAPWSNGYEALTYIAWATVLAGIIFAKRSSITLSSTAILGSLILHTAHLSWMDPEITNLVPVLKSYWLVIHVAIITASYGFLALAAILAFINLLIMFFESKKNKERIDYIILNITNIIEMTIIVGLYMLTIGTFLGGVWANESWGRYWGWDPKETWALVTVLIYAFIAHMRLVPALKSKFGFNLAALLGFGSVIMTYFGVNYYLSGLHSYAKGDPLPVPSFVYYTLTVIIIISLLAYTNQRRLQKVSEK